MISIWRSLIWKEWNEHKWKLAALAGVQCSASLSAMIVERGQDRLALAFGLLMLSSIPLAVFIGLGTASSERSRGTLPFVQGLPIPMWRVALVKLLTGLAIIALSIAGTMLLIWASTLLFTAIGIDLEPAVRTMTGGGPLAYSSNFYVDVFAFCMLIAESLYLWTAVAGVNGRDEVRAAIMALAAMAVWVVLTILVTNDWILLPGFLGDSIRTLMISAAPAGVAAIGATTNQSFSFSLPTAFVTYIALSGIYVWRFGRVSEVPVKSPQTARRGSRADWLPPPRRSQLTAVIWKQFRESGAIAGAGLLGALVTVMITMLGVWIANADSSYVPAFGWLLSRIAFVFGLLIALVVGIGVCINDMTPGISTFWRSRPIQPDLWFWCKFVTGLGVVIAVINIPVLLVGLVDPSTNEGWTYPQGIVLPLGQIAIYATAVAVTSLVRHAVYAAILSLPALYLVILFCSWTVYLCQVTGILERPERYWSVSDTQVMVACVLGFVGYTLLAWLAMRNDWGRKSRY